MLTSFTKDLGLENSDVWWSKNSKIEYLRVTICNYEV